MAQIKRFSQYLKVSRMAAQRFPMENKKFLNAADVAEYMEVSVPKAYKIIRSLNDELVAQGYLVVAGRVSRNYFLQKIYGGYCA